MAYNWVLIRHGPAGDREKFRRKVGLPDELRPLTGSGRKVVQGVGRFLRWQTERPQVIYYSPLVRTLETAEVLAEIWPGVKMRPAKELRPKQSQKSVRNWLKKLSKESSIWFVGHEPELSGLLSFILTGEFDSISVFKKGGFAILEMASQLRDGVRLKCFMSPSQARKRKKK